MYIGDIDRKRQVVAVVDKRDCRRQRRTNTAPTPHRTIRAAVIAVMRLPPENALRAETAGPG